MNVLMFHADVMVFASALTWYLWYTHTSYTGPNRLRHSSIIYSILLLHILYYVLYIVFFFYQGFLSRTLTAYRTAGEGRGPSFIPLYHYHLLTNIHTFICNFACEMTITYFQSQRLYLKDCYSMSFTTLSN